MFKSYLILYFGFYQLCHAVVNIRGIALLMRGEMPDFPIRPPENGWSPELFSVFTPLAVLDLLVAGLTVYCVSTASKNPSRTKFQMPLTAMAVLGHTLFFAIALMAGAWNANTVFYGLIFVSFVLVYILFFFLLREASYD